MEDDELGDWRIIDVVTQLTRDLPEAYPGGSSHRAGAPVYLATLAKHKEYKTLGFITPSPIALALDIAHKYSLEAENIRPTIPLTDVVTPYGKGKAVTKDNLSQLYDYFEYCMLSVVFSYQAIESFANWIIGRRIKKPFQVQRKGGIVELPPEELERNLSTEEKISQVLPKVFSVSTPKGETVWEKFKRLKTARDTIVHLKSLDVNPKLDKESLFYQFFNSNPTEFPKVAFDVVMYFYQTESEPRWAKHLRMIMNKNNLTAKIGS